MDKEAASSLVSAAAAMDVQLGQMFEAVERLSEGNFKAALKRAVGDLMGYIARDIIFPIVDRYPDLNPDKKAGS